MRFLYVFAFVVIMCLHCAKNDQQPDHVSLETRVRWLETEIQYQSLINRQSVINSRRLNDLERWKLGAEKEAPAEDVSADVENCFKGDMEKDINVFKDYVSETIQRSARGLATEKVWVRKTAAELGKILDNQGDEIEGVQEKLEKFLDQYNDDRASITLELNAQLREAIGQLNDTFTEFRKEMLPRKEVLVTKPPKPSCQPGWFQLEDRCYLHVKEGRDKKPWRSAAKDCQKRGGKLAEPKTAELCDKIVAEVDDYGVWIGGTDKENEGNWVWSTTNTPISYDRWAPWQPDNSDGDQDCILVWDKKWTDETCWFSFPYMCEKAMAN